MKLTTQAAVAAGTLAAVAALGVAHSGDSKGPVNVDPETATYTELSPGASQSAVRGDPATGAHGAFTKFVPNFEAGLHTHTNDLRIVVVKGAYVYKPEQGDAIRVTAGQYLLIPGGVRHSTGSDAKDETVFYQEADGKFDLNPVE
jgi:quercetin dioxygenase-like cupin family protein